MREIWVAGCPSFVGGADTELYHQIILWRQANIPVVVVPNGSGCLHPKIKTHLKEIGCKLVRYTPSVFGGKVVVNYCNGPALSHLDHLTAAPDAYVFFNRMTWVFPQEIKHIKNRKITHLGFVSNYQKQLLLEAYARDLPDMKVDGAIQLGRNFPAEVDYFPYFDISQYPVFTKSADYFGVGRISRDDPAKFSPDCWRIFERVLSPIPKKTFVLGYTNKIEEKVGKPPEGLDFLWWSPGMVTTEEFYSKIDCMIHKTGGSRESYCRVLVEAMAHGVVPLVERAFAFPEILGGDARMDWLMCGSSDEMSYKASQLAFDPAMLKYYKAAVRRYVQKHLVDPKRSLRGWHKLLG